MFSQNLQGTREGKALAFSQVPETCPVVRQILDTVLHEFMLAYSLPKEDIAIGDDIISRAFCAIRDRATHPLRQALVNALDSQPL